MSKERGFTFTEVTIAGVILTVGMVSILQMTRQALDTTDPSDPTLVQNSQVIEQYMRAQVASIKALRANPPAPAPLASVSMGTGSLYVTISSNNAGLPAPGTVGNNFGITYDLMEYEVKVQMTMAAHHVQVPETDPVLGHAVFWKLGNNGTFKTAL